MYATLFAWALACWPMSANSLVGGAWLGPGVVAATMVPDEEVAFIEAFGDAYRGYLRRGSPF